MSLFVLKVKKGCKVMMVILFVFPGATISKEPKTTITAKPQIRNTQAELTKLVPTALRVKREQRQKVKKPGAEGFESAPQQPAHPAQKVTTGATKDDAYAQFMKEMAGLL